MITFSVKNYRIFCKYAQSQFKKKGKGCEADIMANDRMILS